MSKSSAHLRVVGVATIVAAVAILAQASAQTLTQAAAARPPASTPASSAGLEVTIQPLKALFAPDEPLVMTVTFRNVSAAPMRTPDRVINPVVREWKISAVDLRTGAPFTGALVLAGGAAPRPGDIVPALLQPGETQSTDVVLRGFAFVKGDMARAAASNTVFQFLASGRGTPRGDELIRLTGRGRAFVPPEFHLPAARYRLAVTIEFYDFPSRPNLPEDIRVERARLDAGPVPIWKGGAILSGPVEVEIATTPGR